MDDDELLQLMRRLHMTSEILELSIRGEANRRALAKLKGKKTSRV